MSLAVSEAEDWANSGDDSPAPPKEPDAIRPRQDSELIRILTKAVEEQGLEWSDPEEATHSHLDEWFLQRPMVPPATNPVHEESWHASYSVCIHYYSSSALTSVDGTEKKRYSRLLPLEDAITMHLCPIHLKGT